MGGSAVDRHSWQRHNNTNNADGESKEESELRWAVRPSTVIPGKTTTWSHNNTNNADGESKENDCCVGDNAHISTYSS